MLAQLHLPSKSQPWSIRHVKALSKNEAEQPGANRVPIRCFRRSIDLITH